MVTLFTKRIFSLFVLISIVLSAQSVCAHNDESVQFIFVGHIRGPKNFTINSLVPYFVEDIKGIKKDFVVIAGDMICGYKTAYDSKGLEREWDLLDTYLNKIEVPVYRIPGNHDWHSVQTKEVYESRYGLPYYAFRVKNTVFIALHLTRLCPDPSLDWAWLWSSDSDLPNKAEIPTGAQWNFLRSELSKASQDLTVQNIIILLPEAVWLSRDTRLVQDWEQRVHPLLVETRKVRLVLAGDAPSFTMPIEKDGIIYLQNGMGITEKDFSLLGIYLQIVIEKDSRYPKIYTHFINMTYKNYLLLMSAIPVDTQSYLEALSSVEKGKKLSLLHGFRMRLKSFLNRHLKLYR